MKKKTYIQPHVTVVMMKHSVPLLAGSDNFKAVVLLDEVGENDID